MKNQTPCCKHDLHEGNLRSRPWYGNFSLLTVLGSVILYCSSALIPFLNPFQKSFAEYLRLMLLPLTAGFLLGGLIDYFVPREYVSKFLGRKTKRTVLYAVGLGFLMTACSHGILALSMELHKKGASGPAVVSFLLASPWANLPITFLLIGFFGWKGLLIILTALLIAVVTGFVFQGLDSKGWIETNRHAVSVDSGFSIRKDIAGRIRGYKFCGRQILRDLRGVGQGIWQLSEMVLGWILVGILLASFAEAFIPTKFFHQFVGPSIYGLLATLAAATVLEVCSEGTSPLAFEIYRQTGALGNAFAFLMGGVVTDYTEIGLVWMNLGRRTALWMVGVTIPQVMVLGWLFNAM